MTKVHFIRHGESDWNIVNKVQGQKNSQLTERGKEQARRIAERLKNIEIDVIYCSDLTRAHKTAKVIGSEKNIEPIVNKNLKEMNFGIWEGMLFSDIKEKYKEDYMKWIKCPEYLEIPEGETLKMLEKRVGMELRNIIEKHKDENILIVSHGTALKTMILSLLGISLDNYKNLAMGNVSWSTVELKDYNNVLTRYNDMAHLEEKSNG